MRTGRAYLAHPRRGDLLAIFAFWNWLERFSCRTDFQSLRKEGRIENPSYKVRYSNDKSDRIGKFKLNNRESYFRELFLHSYN